ncbi:hypothetical protein [Amycolatopsis sp. EV170708-02-1]|uniref:hypothetical protein n=1 Tax=Amycolatopsis sp. EV170708-02-1 TaxID=2919322 RepID=UPI001F0B9909|nr:hypothetical protein [Amycolatopsis sp. EV170708-02-1]UMP06974.1 hypothetical protein MJQ72_20125 [Amycolatopsis sp. EV170708-02-1]
MTIEAKSLASSLAEDDDNLLVVADLPIDSSAVIWEALASALPKERRGIRLVLVHQPVEVGPMAAKWLCDRLGRPVVVPDGHVFRAAEGSLFVHSGWAGGWVRFRPGHEPQWESKRFPRPAWDSQEMAELRRTGPHSVAEPLPAGMWIRTHGPEAWLDPSRTRLRRTLPCRPDGMTIVLGGQGIPELPLADVAHFWATVPPAHRQGARFVHYGAVTLPAGVLIGQALADLLEDEVTCYSGIPVGDVETPQVFTLRPDGSHGWNTYAQQYVYQPRNSAAPRLSAFRPPAADLPETGPAVYTCAPDAVVEVVRTGLWVRPTPEPAHATAVRAEALDPKVHMLRYEAADDAQAERMRTIAETLLGELDYSTRLVTRLEPVTVASPAETQLPWLSSLLETQHLELVEKVNPDLEAEASVPVEDGDDRSLLKATFEREFAEHTSTVEAVLARNSKLVVKASEDASAVVTDAVALRMYLAGQGPPDVDRELRAARPGVHAALGRCVAAGLHRLPVHRGTAVSCLTPTPVEWEFYGRTPVLTERGFLHLLAAPRSGGDTDLLVWSMTGRRTALLEPDDDRPADRIVFLPGTSFKVLELIEPSGDARGRIFLRELSPTEIDADGTFASNRVSLDKLASTAMRRSVERWAGDQPAPPVPRDEAGRFRTLPGVP